MFCNRMSERPQEPHPERTRCEIWTRVMGYFRPVSSFNIGKKSEHYSREHFKEMIAENKQFIKEYKTRGL